MKRESPILAAAWFYAAAFGYSLLDIRMDAGELGPLEVFAVFFRATLWFALLPLALRALDQLPPRLRFGVADAAASVLAATLLTVISDSVFIAVMSRIGPPQYMYMPRSATFIQIMRCTLRFAEPEQFFVLAALAAARWTSARMTERDEAARAAGLQTRLAEARLQLLRSQLHPHFLFNSLNSVAALIRNDRAEATRMLVCLRRFYSLATSAHDRDRVTLGEELSLAIEYLEIEQIRFGPRLAVAIDVASDLRGAEVPTLMLQPLVENAVKHGITRIPGSGYVTINARRESEELLISVENSSDAVGAEPAAGVGLANTRARLAETYGSAARLITAAGSGRFRVTIALPLRIAALEAA